MTDTRLQDLKIADEWAKSQVERFAGSQRSKPEVWAAMNKKYDDIHRIYVNELVRFIDREVHLEEQAQKMQKALDEIEAADPNAFTLEEENY